MPVSSTTLTARSSCRARGNSVRHPTTSVGASRANAEQWFNDKNQNVARAPHATFVDSISPASLGRHGAKVFSDDPPFYLHDRSSSDMNSACAVPSDQNTESLLKTHHPRLPARIESSDSTSEEFRGVIDDLTVKNKKLRQKLKKYEKLHCSHLQEEKLFEVRVHGLPVQRKLELEQLLRNFAASLEEPPDRPGFAPIPEPTSILLDPPPSLHEPASSSTSYSKPHDSAYASISASGQTLNSQSNPNPVTYSEKANSKGQVVRSYLHDIPPGLLPRRSPFLSTKAKRKVVVRRLEQLFTGRGGVSKDYNQSHQQQEVSQSAAQVERRESGAGEGRFEGEGLREARILPVTAQHLTARWAHANPAGHARDHNDAEDERLGSGPASREGTPDQRPTRPLDLDLHRAQVPAENIQYLKHLGIASPGADSSAGASSLNGWVYLNLLVGMAQLHTLNVTLGFIRKAIVEFSTKFELSADGRKIRWIGGSKGPLLSSDSGESVGPTRGLLPDTDHRAAWPHRTAGSSRKKLGSEVHSDAIGTSQASNYNSSADFAGTDPRPFFLAPPNSATSFHYKPLFLRRGSSEDEECDNHDEDSFTSSRKAEHSNTLESMPRDADASARKPNGERRKKESGPIIFYKNASFCTDLSGDLDHDSRDGVTFARYVKDPIGHDEGRGPSGGVRHDPEMMLPHSSWDPPDNVEADTDSSCLTDTCLTLEEMSLVDDDDTPSRIKPVYLEVSGLGGVQPQDNFCVEVQMQHGGPRSPSGDYVPSERSPPKGRRSAFPITRERFYRVQAAGGTKAPQPVVKPKMLSLTTTSLPHSILPEPSYVNLPFTSDNEEDDEESSDNSEDGRNRKRNILPLSILDDAEMESEKQTPLEMLFGSTDNSSGEDSEVTLSDGSDDSSSIDLLAHARELDPETIAAREREFDSNVGLPLAEVPAGSSAATAGGGSGLPSEPSDSCSETTQEENSCGPNVKRRRL